MNTPHTSFAAPSLSPTIKRLLIANVAVFLLVGILVPPSRQPLHELNWIDQTFALSRNGLLHGKLWQLVSYMFLHGSFMHILFNMFGLYFFGSELERALGARRFLTLYFLCGILGGLGWALTSSDPLTPCVGASGGVLGLLAGYATLFPARRITLLVMFVLPVTMTARTLAIGYGMISLFQLGMNSQPSVAHVAHLAGGVAGYFIMNHWKQVTAPRHWMGNASARWRRHHFTVRQNDGTTVTEVEVIDWDEVDAILDKVKGGKLSSLTREERDILQRASKMKR